MASALPMAGRNRTWRSVRRWCSPSVSSAPACCATVRRRIIEDAGMAEPTERWSGRVGFILAAVGSAVGLGSVWKFPYEVGANGGSAFVLFYMAGVVLVVGG